MDGSNIKKDAIKMRRLEAMSVIEDSFPWIKNHYGRSKFKKCFPSIKYHDNIYARLSGIEDAQGEESESIVAEYARGTNTIWLYTPNINNPLHLISSLLHEYTHYLQSPTWMKRYYDMGYEYTNHPYELEALEAERLAETVQVLTQINY